jgi:adenosylmethionine---8-amino-7-oxononanoate aminotransferase
MTELQELDKRHVWHPFTQMAEWDPLVIARGDGNYLFDESGARYFDGVSSLWCNVHGHNQPRLNQALIDQMRRVSHSTFLGCSHEPAIRLAAKLVELAPTGLTRVFYSDSGSAAVEIALKQSFQFWQLSGCSKKQRFVRIENAYHGDTLGAVAVGGIDVFHKIFGPLLHKSIGIPTPYVPAWEGAEAAASGLAASLRALDDALLDAATISAVVMEPLIQGAGGMLTHPAGFLRSVAERCKRAGVHLIVDEVATGFGRTGRMFACEHEGITPDFLCLSKGISGGYLPLAATMCGEQIFNAFLGSKAEMRHFFHGHTYTANPLACAVGLESLVMLTEGLDRVTELSRKVSAAARSLANESHVREVRTCGAMVGIELGNRNGSALEWQKFCGAEVCSQARKYGLLLRPLGDVVVWMPPMSTTDSEIDGLLKGTRAAIFDVLS